MPLICAARSVARKLKLTTEVSDNVRVPPAPPELVATKLPLGALEKLAKLISVAQAGTDSADAANAAATGASNRIGQRGI